GFGIAEPHGTRPSQRKAGMEDWREERHLVEWPSEALLLHSRFGRDFGISGGGGGSRFDGIAPVASFGGADGGDGIRGLGGGRGRFAGDAENGSGGSGWDSEYLEIRVGDGGAEGGNSGIAGDAA